MKTSMSNTLKINGSLYIGHPLAEKRYLTNLQLKVAQGLWNLNISKLKDTVVGIKLVHSKVDEKKLSFDQERKIKLSDAILLSDGGFFSSLSEEDLSAIHESCHKLRANDNFLSFELYAERVKSTSLKPLDELKGLTPEEAILYVQMRDAYDADIKYSNKDVLYWDHLIKDTLFLACYEDPINFLVKLGYVNNAVNAVYIDVMNN